MEEHLKALEQGIAEMKGLVAQVRMEQVRLLKLAVLLWVKIDLSRPEWKAPLGYLEAISEFTGLHPLNVQECFEMLQKLEQLSPGGASGELN